MRVFIAVWVNEIVRENITHFLNEVSERAKGIKWTLPTQLHFTMKFLGEQPREMVKKLSPFLLKSGKGISPFSISLGGGGAFPSWNSPRVFWIGLKEGAEDFRALALKIEEETENLGLPREKKSFHPHLTVGRIKSPVPVYDRLILERGIKGEMVVSGFSLVESVLTKQGPVYRDIERYKLG